MVGGVVIELLPTNRGLWVNCEEQGRFGSDQRCAIYIEQTLQSARIMPGDQLWWQGEWAFWTSAKGGKRDVRFNRIGYSGVYQPLPEEVVN